MTISHITEPLDLIKLNLDEKVLIKCKGDRELIGILHAYDPHMNLIMGPVTETMKTKTVNTQTGREEYLSTERTIELLFIRGDGVILVSPIKTSKTA